MTDLEMTRLCAEAIEITGWLTGDDPMVTNAEGEFIEPYDPLYNDAQAMALVKNMALLIGNADYMEGSPGLIWIVSAPLLRDQTECSNPDLNRAIVECVAKLQKAKVPA